MKNFVLLSAILTGTSAFAADGAHNCLIRKSVIKYDQSTGQVTSRKAETNTFTVSADEHDAGTDYDLKEANGTLWGQVNVTTGTLVNNSGSKISSVTAIVKKANGDIGTWLGLILDVSTPKGSSMTMMHESGDEFEPTLEIVCTAKN